MTLLSSPVEHDRPGVDVWRALLGVQRHVRPTALSADRAAKFDVTGGTGTWNATVSQAAVAGSSAANSTLSAGALAAGAATAGLPSASQAPSGPSVLLSERAECAVTAAPSSVRPTVTSTVIASLSVSARNGSAAALAKPAVGVAVAALFAAAVVA